MILSATGNYSFTNTHDLDGTFTIASDREVARVCNETNMRPAETGGWFLAGDELDALQIKLDIISDGEFSKCVARTERAIKVGNEKFLKYPPAWALLRLRSRIREGEINFVGDDGAASAYLFLLQHLVSRWHHHPRFSLMAKELVYNTPHTMAVLTAASYLADRGNPIGFTDSGSGRSGSQSPDLFVNLGPSDRVSIEVKAPSELQWPNDSRPSYRSLEQLIRKQLTSARGQITSTAGGIVVIGASVLSHENRLDFEATVDSLIEQGNVSVRIAAVTGICFELNPQVMQTPDRNLSRDVSAKVFVKANPNFEGPDFLKT